MTLEVIGGYASVTGERPSNADFSGMVMPERELLEAKGIVAGLADGVGNIGGREAAEYSVRGLLSDYYATPDTWAIPYALDKVLRAINSWLLAQSASKREDQRLVSTLSVLVLRGDRYVIGHVGDSRAYLLRDRKLQSMTTDHVWDRPGMQHVLRRAMGLDQHLAVDYCDGALNDGDIFLLASDGVWEALGDKLLHELLYFHQEPQRAADVLVNEAVKRGGKDNATAVVMKITKAGEANRHSLAMMAQDLIVPERLKPGQRLDDFEILKLVHESKGSLLYQVRHVATQQVLVLKTLPPALQDDLPSRENLLAEEWLAKRLISHYFPQVLPLSSETRHFLYYVMTFHEGATLQQHLDHGRHFSVAEAVQIGIRLGKAMGVMHRMEIIHRDIKPDNVHLDMDGKLRLLDLGVALNPATMQLQGNPGTPSFIAPELLARDQPSRQSDLYALGVTVYYLLTRKYPYGEIEPFQRPRFTEPLPPTRYRPDIPQWLENMLLKAVSKDPVKRFETAEEWVLSLQQGEHASLMPPLHAPLLERDPLLLCQRVAAVSVLINLLLFYLLWAM